MSERKTWCSVTPWWAEGKRYQVVVWHKRFNHIDVMAASDDADKMRRFAMDYGKGRKR